MKSMSNRHHPTNGPNELYIQTKHVDIYYPAAAADDSRISEGKTAHNCNNGNRVNQANMQIKQTDA